MARSALAVQPVVRTGLLPVFTAADALGHTMVNDGHTAVYVKNGGGAPINVTFITPGIVDSDINVPDRIVAVPAGSEQLCGPFPIATYADPLLIDYSAVTTVTVAALKIPA